MNERSRYPVPKSFMVDAEVQTALVALARREKTTEAALLRRLILEERNRVTRLTGTLAGVAG